MAKTVEITTTQHVVIEYELAALRDRLLALLLDLTVTFVGWLLIMLFVLLLDINNVSEAFAIYLSVGWIVAFFLYHTISNNLMDGRTLGKSALGIKIVRLDGKKPKWMDYLLRSMLYFLDLLASSGLVGAILIKITPKAQRLGDIAANTTVVKVISSAGRFSLRDILNISTIENYNPVYPQVRQLSEQDMILIKNALARQSRFRNEAHEYALETLADHIGRVLRIEPRPHGAKDFLRTLLRDYIVLTR
jgi:uncharacterized RDD family membrane protein YckC